MAVNILSLAVVLGVLIFFHELGHFLVARFFGIGVEKFSLGFGPRIFGKRFGRTEYILAAIPLGGYVKMVGEEPGAEISPEDMKVSFLHKPVIQRILTVAAGPFFNFLLAAVIFFVLFQIQGVVKPVVGKVMKGTPAEKVGLMRGDHILAIDGQSFESWDKMADKIRQSEGMPLSLTVKRGETRLDLSVTPELTPGYNEFREEIKFYDIGIARWHLPIVGGVQEESPAQKAGLLKGDLITALNGVKIHTWSDMVIGVTESEGKSILVSVKRGESVLDFPIQPEHKVIPEGEPGGPMDRYVIGVAVAGEFVMNRLSLVQSMVASVEKTAYLSKLIVLSVVKICQGVVSSKEIGGPIIIAQMAGERAREGFFDLLYFIAFISINLGILNLFPIPVLDGGHLVFFTIEAIMRRPLSLKMQQIAQQIGLVLLISLMFFVFYNDITRVFFS